MKKLQKFLEDNEEFEMDAQSFHATLQWVYDVISIKMDTLNNRGVDVHKRNVLYELEKLIDYGKDDILDKLIIDDEEELAMMLELATRDDEGDDEGDDDEWEMIDNSHTRRSRDCSWIKVGADLNPPMSNDEIDDIINSL